MRIRGRRPGLGMALAATVVATSFSPLSTSATAAGGCGASGRIAYAHDGVLNVVTGKGRGAREVDRPPDRPLSYAAASPSWSPKGHTIAYAVNRIGLGPAIRTVSADGRGRTTLRRIPVPEAYAFEVQWSPNGRYIAFVLFVYNYAATAATRSAYGSHTELMVMNADGSGLHPVVTAQAVPQFEFSWSPDSKRLAFASSGAIFTVAADGRGVPRRVTPLNVTGSHPMWAPRGGWIAFIGGPGLLRAPSLYLVKEDGTHAVRRLPVPARGAPAWAPKGKRLAVTTPIGIELIRRDGRGRHLLNGADGDSYWPTWSPDGRRIAFTRDDPFEVAGTRSLMVAKTNGSGARPIVEADWLSGPFAWCR